MVSIVASQHTVRGFDNNCGQLLFVSLGKALNMTVPPTTHEYNGYQPKSLGVSLRQTSVLSRETLFSAACATEIGDKHLQYGFLGVVPGACFNLTLIRIII